MKTFRVYSLLSNEVFTFMGDVPREQAVAFCHCDKNGKLSELYAALQDGTFEEFKKTLPYTSGERSIACGDWATLKEVAA